MHKSDCLYYNCYQAKMLTFETHHEKTSLLPMPKQTHTTDAQNCATDQCLCLCYIDSTMAQLHIINDQNIKPLSSAVQQGLCQSCPVMAQIH